MDLFKKMQKESVYIKADWAAYRTEPIEKKVFKTTPDGEKEISGADGGFADALLDGDEITKEEYETQKDSSKIWTVEEWLKTDEEEFAKSGLSIKTEKMDWRPTKTFTTILRPIKRKNKY